MGGRLISGASETVVPLPSAGSPVDDRRIAANVSAIQRRAVQQFAHDRRRMSGKPRVPCYILAMMVIAFWVLLVAVPLAQIGVTVRLWKSALYAREQQIAQTVLVWLLPLIGAIVVYVGLRHAEDVPGLPTSGAGNPPTPQEGWRFVNLDPSDPP